MISKELQNSCKKKFNGTSRYIILAEEGRRVAFKNALPQFLEVQDNLYVSPNNSIWKIIVPDESTFEDKQIVEAIVDTQIDESFFKRAILPACAVRCTRIEFFN